MTPLSRLLLAALAVASLPALSLNHDTVVSPVSRGPYRVQCSNLEVDLARLATLGGVPDDYWEGRSVNGLQRYATDILADPASAVFFAAPVPDERRLYPQTAGGTVPMVAVVCHPTPASNANPDYALPGGGGVLPHMRRRGEAPQLIGLAEYAAGRGIFLSPPPPPGPAPLPLILYSHGLGGSPVGSGYVEVMVELAAQGYVVAAAFHGDPRFSRVRIEDLEDFAYFLLNFDRIVEMQALRPVELKAMLDTMLASPYAPAIDRERIGGFGASLGGQAMMHLAGARITSSLSKSCADPVHDGRIRAAVTFVPYAGQSFLPAFCDDQSGADFVNAPILSLAGTADTTAPIGLVRQAVNRFSGTRYLVELEGGQHELRPEDVGDLFTWMVTFLNAHLDVRWDPGAMARLIRMAGVTGGRPDRLTIDVHVPTALAAGESLAVEFHNTDLDHYFMATGRGEIEGILSGAAGAGWRLTGQSFKAFDGIPPDAATLVTPTCRFYGVPAGGPNSHFFTAFPDECEQVKRNGGWFYEGIGFHIAPSGPAGCPAGWLGVNRAYNNGFPRNDSNHRYSTSDSTMAQMARQGWTVEGLVMCSRP